MHPATRDASIRALVRERVAQVPELQQRRGEISKLLRDQAAAAWDAGAVYCAGMAEPVLDGVLPATVTVFLLPGPLGANSAEPDRLAALLPMLTGTGCRAAARRRVQDPGPRGCGAHRAGREVTVSDFVPTPEQQRIIDEANRRREEALRNPPPPRRRPLRGSEFALGLTPGGDLQPGGGRPITPPDPNRPPRPSMEIRSDRAAGALIGAACGDALGVPYEFQPRLADDQVPTMRGGGLVPYEPGEYSDDTQMQVVIAQVAATGLALDEEPAQRAIAEGFIGWLARGASDVGAQTRRVLSTARGAGGDPLEAIRKASEALHQQTGRSAGNGSLMRTGVVGLGFLNGSDAVHRCRDAARAISSLTHYDPLAGDACVLLSEGVREAVLHDTPGLWRFGGVRTAVELLPAERRRQWTAWLDEAQDKPPHAFNPNGFVVPALQAAWSAIYRTQIPDDRPEDHFRLALEAAVRAGDDTDTVAAIAGALLGAAWGRAAIPAQWQRIVHGCPGLDAEGLAGIAARIIA